MLIGGRGENFRASGYFFLHRASVRDARAGMAREASLCYTGRTDARTLPSAPEARMLLSIVIPTYNMAEWLPVALESCLWQTRGDFEVIVLDDGSTDAGPDIARAYARLDSRLRVISQSNAGLGAARQAGQDAAGGDCITWLDADDFLAPEAVAAWLAPAERGADMVCANAVAFSHRTFNARRYFYHPPAEGLRFDHSPEYWKSKVVWRWIISLPFIRRHGLTHPRYKLGQDVCFMYAALVRAERFSQCAPFAYYFRQEHKSAHSSVQVQVEHALAHFIEARDILLNPPDGVPRRKSLIRYLNENYWRDVRKLAPRLVGPDAVWKDRAIELGLALFQGLDPAWFRAAALAPEVREESAFLPLADALIAGDADTARALFDQLRDAPLRAPDKNTLFHTLRHRAKALVHPLARSARTYLRELESRAARRFPGNGAA